MQTRLMTEYEWRKRARRIKKRHASYCGAQCIFPSVRKKAIHKYALYCLLLSGSAAFAFVFPLLYVTPIEADFPDGCVQTEDLMQVREVSAISYLLPDDYRFQERIFTRSELLRGKMLLLDEEHLLPQDVPPPNTFSAAKYANGMVPVRSFAVKTGEETLDALKALFAELKKKRMNGIYVWQGAVTKQQQRSTLVAQTRKLMENCVPEAAVQQATQLHGISTCTELLQEYTVELRLLDQSTHLPQETALEASIEGQTLLQLAWRYGFIRSNLEYPYRFRFVGKAHAMAMTYLDLELKKYLEWMHVKKNLVISAGGKPQYLILCQPMSGEHIAVDLPVNCDYEASLDNMGYVLVACTL